MALNLKHPQILHAIDELARLTGQSKSESVASAIEARLVSLLDDNEAATTTVGTPQDRLSALIGDSATRFARGFGSSQPRAIRRPHRRVVRRRRPPSMIVDTSAVITILRGEPRAGQLAEALLGAGGAQISAANYVEAGAVVDRIGDPVLSRRLYEFLSRLHMELAPAAGAQLRAARAAYADFGKGNGNPAVLDFGDCLTYGLAKATGQPLVDVGHDFVQTDLHSARKDESARMGQ